VCSLVWSRHEREILSSHGYSKNQLCLWRYPSLVKVGNTVLQCLVCGYSLCMLYLHTCAVLNCLALLNTTASSGSVVLPNSTYRVVPLAATGGRAHWPHWARAAHGALT
jgi:hypothetical protein